MELVTKVWIAPGCIVCDACETTAPDVFEVQHDNETCIIRPEALDMEFTKPRTKDIIQAAEECPVDVIKFELVPTEVSEEQAKAMAAAPAAPKPAASHAPSAAPAGPAPTAAEPATAAAKASPAKPVEPPKPKVLDPAIQALLAATTARGGNVVINRSLKSLPEPAQKLAKLSPDQLPPDARYQKVIEKTKEKKAEPTRRDVLLGIGWTATALAFGAIPVAAFNRFMAPNVLEEEDPKVRCGSISKYRAMAPGEVNEDFKPVKPSGFWIIREEERIAALSIICTHLGCIPSWLPNDRKFKCPCHGSGFKPDGRNFEGPTPRPLERFKIYLDGDEVIVDRSRKFLAMGPTDTAVWNDPDASIPA
jgi:cytochrome b6-f complex iron-sulfur subunit